MASTLNLTRDQLAKFCGDDSDMLRKFEQLILGVQSIPGLEDGVDSNTLAISTLSDLVRPITINLIQPLSSAPSGDVSFILSGANATEGTKGIYIPSTYLIATAAGPFTLTITTGSGSVVTIPIGASTYSIVTGDLLFFIHIDSSGNVVGDDWTIEFKDSSATPIKYMKGSRVYPDILDYRSTNGGTRTETVVDLEIGQTAIIQWTLQRTAGTISLGLPAGGTSYECCITRGTSSSANTLVLDSTNVAVVNTAAGAAPAGSTVGILGGLSGVSLTGWVRRTA